MNSSLPLFATNTSTVPPSTFSEGALSYYSQANTGKPRITLTDGEVFINGTHAANTVTVDPLNSNTIRVTMIGIDVRDFNISDVDSIRFFGRKGNDRFTNTTAIPGELYGHDGNDRINGGDGVDRIWGGFGDDVIYGGGDDDWIWAGNGRDIVLGDEGDDHIYGQGGDDTLHGRNGNDIISGANGNDRIYGNNGDDTLTGDAGDDYVNGNWGSDLIHGWTGEDTLLGEQGSDYIFGDHEADYLNGGVDHDFLYGGPGDDTLRGSYGNDFLNGQDGDDQLFGEQGNDGLHGLDGNDNLFGQAGDDYLRGGDGFDLLSGFGGGADDLGGGVGRDILIAGADSTPDVIRGNQGADSILFFGNDIIDFGSTDLKLKLVNKTSDWTENEMLVIADAMESLYQATGNNRLMTDKVVGKVLTLEKYSSLPGGAAAINYMTINTNNGNTTYTRAIRFADWDETNEALNPWRKLAFIHEISHNFDDPFELAATPDVSWSRLTNFWSKSGWTQSPPNTTHYVRSGDGQWWHLKSAEFSRDYGKTNRYEDWGTMWEYFFDPNATPPEPGSNLASKLNSVTSFFSALS